MAMPPSGPQLDAFVANQAFLRRLARELVGDPGRADDLVQDTWLTWREDAPSAVRAPRAWLAQALRWRAGNERRERERRTRRERLVARAEGDPDGSERTLDTLEVQAHVVTALRSLTEPVRSTLVQRYFHDWTPRRIAAEAGVPLNTVKARLQRGLQQMRVELDRRHGGKRSSWCHLLLTAVGRGEAWTLTASLTALSAAIARLGLRAFGAFSSLGTWLALASVLAGAFFLWARWPRKELGPMAAETPQPIDVRQPAKLVSEARVAVPESRSTEAQVEGAPELVLEPRPVPFAVEPLPFSWPQLAGSASHDGLFAHERGDLLERPEVLWELGGVTGQPTLLDGDLYVGGTVLVGRSVLSSGRGRIGAQRTARGFGAAPAITAGLVLARLRDNGGLTAFDRDLSKRVWTWRPDARSDVDSPPCLVEDLVIVTLGREVVALHTHDGSVAWRVELPRRESARATPASGAGLLFLGTDGGQVLALDWATGGRVWTLELAGDLGEAVPVIDGQIVYFAGSAMGEEPVRQADLWAVDISGTLAWRTTGAFLAPLSTPGVGTDLVWVVSPQGACALDREDGDELWRRDDPTFDLQAYLRQPPPVAPQPVPVGDRVFVAFGDRLLALDQCTGEMEYAVRVPERERVVDFVHTGDRLYLASNVVLRAIGNAAKAPVLEPGGVFDLDPERRLEEFREELRRAPEDREALMLELVRDLKRLRKR